MGNILGSVIAAAVLYVLPEAMRSLYDLRMILYAVVLIVVMLFTWSPKVKQTMQVITAWFQKKGSVIFKKFARKEVSGNE